MRLRDSAPSGTVTSPRSYEKDAVAFGVLELCRWVRVFPRLCQLQQQWTPGRQSSQHFGLQFRRKPVDWQQLGGSTLLRGARITGKQLGSGGPRASEFSCADDITSGGMDRWPRNFDWIL